MGKDIKQQGKYKRTLFLISDFHKNNMHKPDGAFKCQFDAKFIENANYRHIGMPFQDCQKDKSQYSVDSGFSAVGKL